MKNQAIFESVNNGMKATKKARIEWKKNYHSLSRLLRDMQTVEGFKFAKPIFEALDLPLTRKVKEADLELAHVTDKKGNEWPAFMQQHLVTKEVVVEGQKVHVPLLDKDGKKQYTYDLVAIKEGQWTIDKFESAVRTAQSMK